MNETAYLYRPLKLPGILLILTFIAAYFVYDFIEQATQEIDRHYQQQLREADALYNEVSQLQQKVGLVNTYYGRFQHAYQAGELSDQSRVDWIDQFMGLVKAYDIRRVSLNFSARSNLSASELALLAPMHKLIKQEWVEFEGEFQHEADWLAFVKDVQTSINQFALLNECRLVNMNASEMKPPSDQDYHFHWDRGNVAVKCQFRFLLFDVPEIAAPAGKKP